jgi:hypothetical protein
MEIPPTPSTPPQARQIIAKTLGSESGLTPQGEPDKYVASQPTEPTQANKSLWQRFISLFGG